MATYYLVGSGILRVIDAYYFTTGAQPAGPYGPTPVEGDAVDGNGLIMNAFVPDGGSGGDVWFLVSGYYAEVPNNIVTEALEGPPEDWTYWGCETYNNPKHNVGTSGFVLAHRTNWSATSGGEGGGSGTISAPTINDTLIIDANSPTEAVILADFQCHKLIGDTSIIDTSGFVLHIRTKRNSPQTRQQTVGQTRANN